MRTDDDYPTDVTDDPWALLHPRRPERTWCPGAPGRPPCDVRRLLHGLLTSTRRVANGVWGPRQVATGAPSMALSSAGDETASGPA
jgi:hypothetical protein